VAATLLAYLPVWQAGFIWDDDVMVTGNQIVQADGGLRAIWFSTALPDYFPLTSTALWVQWRLWGANPLGYHLVNVFLHALAAVLWWRVLDRFRIPGAWLAAAIFALHPVNVESVAWISELKNTLAMVFFTLTLLAWLRAEPEIRIPKSEFRTKSEFPQSENKRVEITSVSDCGLLPGMGHWESEIGASWRWRWYAVALVTFVLALLSKTAVAPLPLVLLGLAWWRRGRVTWRDGWRSLPFFAAAALLALVTVWFQHHRAIGDYLVRDDSLWSRLAAAGWAVWFYLYKVFLPLKLCLVYPLWQVDPANALSYAPGLLALGGLAVCWRYRQSWGRVWLFVLGYFVVMLLPVLGCFNISFMRFSLVADRWQYFAIIGPIALVAAGVSRLLKSEIRNPKSEPNSKSEIRNGQSMPLGVRISDFFRISSFGFRVSTLRLAFCSALLLSLGVLTWQQCATFTDLKTLWQATLERNPSCAMAHSNLGDLLLIDGNVDDAIASYRRALAIQPDSTEAHNNLGTALLRKGRTEEAIAHYEQVLKIQPDHLMAHNNLGNIFRQQGRRDDAIVHYRKALEIQPDLAPARHNLGIILLEKGQAPEAVAHFRKLVELQPGSANLHNNLGWILRRAGRLDEALPPLRKALEIRPDYPEAHGNLARTLALLGHAPEAVVHFQAALRGLPDDAEYLTDLAWLLATWPEASVRSGSQAVELAEQANRLSGGGNPAVLRSLAAAYAESGRFTEAVSSARQAVELAQEQSNTALAEALQTQLKLYEAGSPYRDNLKLDTRSSKLE
jgi:tetratricopeptide (TPR) repeat protein